MTNPWNKKTCLLVTGASRGIGRTIAIEFSKRLAPGSLVILTARSLSGLEETKELIGTNLQLKIESRSVDLEKSTERDLAEVVSVIANPNEFEQAMIVHNAASMGDLSKWLAELDNTKELQDYFNMNLFSMILLNNLFINKFSPEITSRYVINITSLWAIEPSQNFVLYCCGKAARDMFAKVSENNNCLSVF
jgi:sepiapterin reductase